MKTFIKFPAKVTKIRLVQLYLWLARKSAERKIDALNAEVRKGRMCVGERDTFIAEALKVIDKINEKSDEIDRELMYLRSL